MLSGDGAEFVMVGEDGAEDDSVDGVNNKIPAHVLPVAMELQEQQPCSTGAGTCVADPLVQTAAGRRAGIACSWHPKRA